MHPQEQTSATTSLEDRYRLLINAITDYAIYMLNPDGLISSWNSGANHMNGFDESGHM